MIQRRFGRVALAATILAASAGVASAQYYEEEGFFLFLDAAFTTPRNTDEVVAVTQSGVSPVTDQRIERIQIGWGSEESGKIGFGYVWPGGNKVTASYWQFDNDSRVVGDGPQDGFMNFAIGPGIYYNSSYYGSYGYPGHFDFVSDIEAESIEASFGRSQEMGLDFSLEWSLGLRYARFEENLSGFYDFLDAGSGYLGYYTYAATMTNEGEMTGFKAAARATYHFSDIFSVNGGFALSFMDGDVTSGSSLVPVGACNTGPVPPCPGVGLDLPSASILLEDGDRSGTISDFDINAVWHLADDRYRISVGYEHSKWDGMPADLTRSTVGNFVPLRARDNVVFSGFKIGVVFRF